MEGKDSGRKEEKKLYLPSPKMVYLPENLRKEEKKKKRLTCHQPKKIYLP